MAGNLIAFSFLIPSPQTAAPAAAWAYFSQDSLPSRGPFPNDSRTPRDEDAMSRCRRMSLTAGRPEEGRLRVRQGAPNEDHLRAARWRVASRLDGSRHRRSPRICPPEGFAASEGRVGLSDEFLELSRAGPAAPVEARRTGDSRSKGAVSPVHQLEPAYRDGAAVGDRSDRLRRHRRELELCRSAGRRHRGGAVPHRRGGEHGAERVDQDL